MLAYEWFHSELYLPSGKVPYLDKSIQCTADDSIVVKLQTRDGTFMTMESVFTLSILKFPHLK